MFVTPLDTEYPSSKIQVGYFRTCTCIERLHGRMSVNILVDAN